MKASIILPTYNESENIVGLIHAILKSKPEGWEFQVIVVDDNSPDRTYEVVQATFKGNADVSAILRTSDRGLAKSLRAGLDVAQGNWVVFMDSDLTHDPAELPKMLRIACEYDVVIGSRFCAGGNMDDRTHYFMSLVYNWIIRLILRTQVQDNLGGYLAIRKAALDYLPMDSIFFGYGDYCFRLIHYAQKQGMTIIEMPANFRLRQRGVSKSHFGHLLVSYTRALILLRLGRKSRPKQF